MCCGCSLRFTWDNIQWLLRDVIVMTVDGRNSALIQSDTRATMAKSYSTRKMKWEQEHCGRPTNGWMIIHGWISIICILLIFFVLVQGIQMRYEALVFDQPFSDNLILIYKHGYHIFINKLNSYRNQWFGNNRDLFIVSDVVRRLALLCMQYLISDVCHIISNDKYLQLQRVTWSLFMCGTQMATKQQFDRARARSCTTLTNKIY